MSEESIPSRRNPPRLAPAPPRSRESDVEANTSTIRRYVTTACSECRVRKLKCSGESPCTSCVEHDRECILDPEGDKRRRLQQRKRINELESSQELLMLLVQRLRDSDRKDAVHLLNFIRGNATLEEIQEFLQRDAMSQISDIIPELIEVQQAISQLQDAAPLSGPRSFLIESLDDKPLFSVPAKPWTNITDDARLVSHLVSIWATWNSPLASCIDIKCLVEAMQTADENSPYCSPFLVNSLLASADSFCQNHEIFRESGDMTPRKNQFYLEATKILNQLLEEDHGLMSLPALQGLAILSICAITNGKDRQGLKNLSLLKHAVGEFIESHVLTSASGEDSSKFERVCNRTFWGIFNIITMVRMGLMAPLDFPVPNCPRVPRNDDNEESWSAYPLTVKTQIEFDTETFDSYCSLSCVVSEICTVLLDGEQRRPSDELQFLGSQLLQRLEEWHHSLPVSLRIETSLSPVSPGILHLDMYFRACIIELLAFVTQSRSILPASVAREREQQLVSSARQLAGSVRTFQSTWGAERMSEMTLPWISFGIATLMNNSGDSESSESLIDLCRAERLFCDRWMVSKGIFRMFQLSVSHLGIGIPHEVRILFDDFEKQHWGRTDPSVFRSCFPNHLMLLADGKLTVEGEMDNFLSKWEKVTVTQSADYVSGEQGG